MNIESVEKTYRRYAPQYDLLFGAVFHPGRKEVIRQMDCQPGERILEVGVGTGLSLPLYPPECHITGIDISKEMLARAERRVARDQLSNVELHQMNAQEMDFADHSFDKVVAMYVASVVPDPVTLVREMQRVCRPGGQLMFVNHFNSEHPVLRRMENLLVPLSAKLGFDPGFSLPGFVEKTGLEIEKNQRVNAFGYWRMLQSTNESKVDELSETVIHRKPEEVDIAIAKVG